MNDFNIAYRVRMPAVARCRIRLGSEKMEEVSEFKYLGTVDGWCPSSVAKCLSLYLSDKQKVYLKWLTVYL